MRRARIDIKCGLGFYEGSEVDRERPFELRTDANGMAVRQCRKNWCVGTQSGFRFTDTYVVYIPRWYSRVFADGYEPSSLLDVCEDYRGKVRHEGSQNDRLPVQIALTKNAER